MTWQEAWEEGRTPWDAGCSAPVLHTLVDSLPTGRAVVPGCGTGYDLLSLAGPNREVVGIDVAPIAKARFEAIAADHPHRDRVVYVVGDAFSFDPGPGFDLMWDYTFLCALPIALRPQWVEFVDRMLRAEGELAALIFPVVPDADPEQGPPYPLTPALVTDLLAPILEPVSIEQVERSNVGREGKEWLGRFRRVR